MPVSFTAAGLEVPVQTLYGFLLVLARILGAFIFLPLPGARNTPPAPKIVLALAVTAALCPFWPAPPVANFALGRTVGWLLAEAAFGIGIGLALAMLTESLVMAAQFMGMQAGYSYASTIDPATEADSGVLLVVAQLAGWLMFLALGLDRWVFRVFAKSLEAYPAGAYQLAPGPVEAVARLGSVMFSTALRLALPVIALLVLVDLAFALIGRVNAQLQLLTLAFPVKMMAALALFAAFTAAVPRLFEGAAAETSRAVARLLGS
jgi:flagellar biosynthetic protein FliR